MWSLIALASVLLIVSITANWVQRTVLNTDEVTETTDEILADDDVEEQLRFLGRVSQWPASWPSSV